MFKSGQVAVTDVAAALLDGVTIPPPLLGGATSLSIVNQGATTVYIDGEGVDDTSGRLIAGATYSQDYVDGDDVWVVCGTGESGEVDFFISRAV